LDQLFWVAHWDEQSFAVIFVFITTNTVTITITAAAGALRA